jgi:hypothetical protein
VRKNQADPLSRVTGPRMNPSVDVGRPPRPFRHLRMAERRSPDPSSSRAPVHSALVQISVTRHHQHSRPAFLWMLGEIPRPWQARDGKKMENGLLLGTNVCTKRLDKSSRRIFSGTPEVLDSAPRRCVPTRDRLIGPSPSWLLKPEVGELEHWECCRNPPTSAREICGIFDWCAPSRCCGCRPCVLSALGAKLREVLDAGSCSAPTLPGN